MKLLPLFGLSAMVLGALVTCQTSVPAQESIKIGVVMPLSGPNAQFGRNSLNGIQLALDDVNGAGGIKSLGGAKIELAVADVPQPSAAAAAPQRLISQDNLVGVIGGGVC